MTVSSRVVEVLLVGGRSGVGKTTVAAEVSALLQGRGVAHCLVDGDNLDAAYPKPADDPHGTDLTQANLRALWANYAAAGHHRMVYVNTVSVLESAMVRDAVTVGDVMVHAVLLTATDATVRGRLGGREVGSGLQAHLDRSSKMATRLSEQAGDDVVRVPTDGRSVTEIATVVIEVTGWAGAGAGV